MKALSLLVLSAICAAAISCGSQDKTAVGVNDNNTNKDSIANAAMADTANYSSIEWIDSTDQNLGTIKEGQVVDLSWRFKNVGTKPLIITHVSAGCGCTVPDPPKEPIAPGKEGKIEAKFNTSGQTGNPMKSVIVRANTKQQEYQLNFSAQVTKQ